MAEIRRNFDNHRRGQYHQRHPEFNKFRIEVEVIPFELVAAAAEAIERWSLSHPHLKLMLSSEVLRSLLRSAQLHGENVETPLTECRMCCTNTKLHPGVPILVERKGGACSEPACQHWIIMRKFAWTNVDVKYPSGKLKCSAVLVFSGPDETWMMWLHGDGHYNPFFRLRTADIEGNHPEKKGIFLPTTREQCCLWHGIKYCNCVYKSKSDESPSDDCEYGNACHFCHDLGCKADLQEQQEKRKMDNKSATARQANADGTS